MVAPVLRGRGNAALAAADNDDDDMLDSMGDHAEGMETPCAAVTHKSARLARARAANGRVANITTTLLPRPGGGTAAVQGAGASVAGSAAGSVAIFSYQEEAQGEAWRLQKSGLSTHAVPAWRRAGSPQERWRDLSALQPAKARAPHRPYPGFGGATTACTRQRAAHRSGAGAGTNLMLLPALTLACATYYGSRTL